MRKLANLSFILLTTFIILLGAVKTSGQIILADSPIDLKPAEFYIAEVIDERETKDAVAKLVTKGEANKTTTTAVDLQGGASAAMNRYLQKNLSKDKSLRAAILGIKEFKLTESGLPNGTVDGLIKLELSFGLQKDYGVAPLITSQFGLKYRRSINNTAQVEGHIRSSIKSALVYFDNWMKTNSSSDWRLARQVKLTFTDYHEKTEGDTIYYSPKRPLTWDDFQWQNMPNSSKYQALVMPGFGYNQEAKFNKGIINAHIETKSFVPKSACWARSTGRDDYALNHEQRHFDIAKIIAEQFKQKLSAEKLTPDNYEASINMQYLDSLRDLDAMQKAYDKETAHGINRTAQQMWNKKIGSELKLNDLVQYP